MLSEAEVLSTVRDLWKRHRDELGPYERIRGYARGELGQPDVPDGVNEELKDIAKLSVVNVIRLVEDAFASGLSVEGFRSPEETENAPAWALWQKHKLDARQGEIHRPTIRYGTAYAIYVDEKLALRSPRQVFAVYEDPSVDDWPVYALETWIDRGEATPVRRARLIDETHVYPLTLGKLTKVKTKSGSTSVTIRPELDGDPVEHGFKHTPVVRFVNQRGDEELVSGEVEPLIRDQKAINTVNFDRLVVSRFGAFKQKYAIGWAPADAEELAKSSVARLMAFDDENVKVGTFDASEPKSYTEILQDMKAQVALSAQVPIVTVLGSLTNVGAETVAIADGTYSRKLKDKRKSLGESWEMLLQLMAEGENEVEVDDAAEVVWSNTDARSFAAVVDGIGKLVTAGVPIEVLVDEIPGWTQQRADQARAAIRRAAGRGVLRSLAGPKAPPAEEAPVNADAG